MSKSMTPKRRAILDFITQYISTNGYSPTLVEVGCGVNLKSPATVHEHIRNLVKMGKLVKGDKRESRNITVPVATVVATVTVENCGSCPLLDNNNWRCKHPSANSHTSDSSSCPLKYVGPFMICYKGA